MAKKALGKGLSALLVSSESSTFSGVNVSNDDKKEYMASAIYLKIEDILVNPLQPRRYFDKAKLEELADSIKIHGVVQPLIVSKVPEGYRLVVGERRYRASKIAGLKEVPAIVRDLADQQILEIALIENLQREDLNPIEEALAFQYLLREHGLTHDKLAERLGCSRPSITNALRLLNLPENIRSDIESGIIKPGHARAILSLEDDKLKYLAWKKIKEDEMSVRQAEKFVAELLSKKAIKSGKVVKKANIDADWQEIVDLLKEKLKTEIKITPRAKGKGRLELYYNDQDELEGIVNMLFYMSRF